MKKEEIKDIIYNINLDVEKCEIILKSTNTTILENNINDVDVLISVVIDYLKEINKKINDLEKFL